MASLTEEQKVEGNDCSTAPDASSCCYEEDQYGQHKSNDVACTALASSMSK